MEYVGYSRHQFYYPVTLMVCEIICEKPIKPCERVSFLKNETIIRDGKISHLWGDRLIFIFRCPSRENAYHFDILHFRQLGRLVDFLGLTNKSLTKM